MLVNNVVDLFDVVGEICLWFLGAAAYVCIHQVFQFVNLFFEHEAKATADAENEAKNFETRWERPCSESIQYDKSNIVHLDECGNWSSWSF